MVNRRILAGALSFVLLSMSAPGSYVVPGFPGPGALEGSQAEARQPQPAAPRFDELVRADFFAGLAGDVAALERAMRLVEATLATDPRRPDVLVWHGSGLLAQAAQAFQKGDGATGGRLWKRGLQEMNDAAATAPDNVAVLIPRGATLLEVSRFVPDANESKALLETGVADYEKVLVLQTPYFKHLSDHARGELLFGLGDGLHRLGQRDRARMYFERLLVESPASQYGSMAKEWLNNPSGASGRHRGCAGCHDQGRDRGGK
jgi:hypothetical protein